MQRPSPLTKPSPELRRIRRRKITRPDASKPAEVHEFLPKSMPRTTMSIGPLLYLSKGQRSYADRCKRGGPSHNQIYAVPGIPQRVTLSETRYKTMEINTMSLPATE